MRYRRFFHCTRTNYMRRLHHPAHVIGSRAMEKTPVTHVSPTAYAAHASRIVPTPTGKRLHSQPHTLLSCQCVDGQHLAPLALQHQVDFPVTHAALEARKECETRGH